MNVDLFVVRCFCDELLERWDTALAQGHVARDLEQLLRGFRVGVGLLVALCLLTRVAQVTACFDGTHRQLSQAFQQYRTGFVFIGDSLRNTLARHTRSSLA